MGGGRIAECLPIVSAVRRPLHRRNGQDSHPGEMRGCSSGEPMLAAGYGTIGTMQNRVKTRQLVVALFLSMSLVTSAWAEHEADQLWCFKPPG